MIKTLTGPQFASTFCLRPEQFAWFLGTGASAAAGIPAGYSMIADFKKRLFCQLSRISLREVDANDSLWLQRIDLFFSTRSELPEPDDPTEYARAFEAIYPTAADRRTYIEQAVTRVSPALLGAFSIFRMLAMCARAVSRDAGGAVGSGRCSVRGTPAGRFSTGRGVADVSLRPAHKRNSPAKTRFTKAKK